MAKRPNRPVPPAAKQSSQRSRERAARRDREVRIPSQETERGSWLRGIRFSGFSLLMMALLVLGVVVLAPNLKAFVEQRQQIAALQAAVNEQSKTVDQLAAERERWNDSTYVMTQARERFFYVNPGEISFLVINDLDPATLPDVTSPISDTLTTTQIDWTQSLFASLIGAAFTEVAPKATSPVTPPTTPPATTQNTPQTPVPSTPVPTSTSKE